MNTALLFGLVTLFYRGARTKRRIAAVKRLRGDPSIEMPDILAQVFIWLVFLVLFLLKGSLP